MQLKSTRWTLGKYAMQLILGQFFSGLRVDVGVAKEDIAFLRGKTPKTLERDEEDDTSSTPLLFLFPHEILILLRT